MPDPIETTLIESIKHIHKLGDTLAETGGVKTQSGIHGAADLSLGLQPLVTASEELHRIACSLAASYKIEDPHWTARAGVRGGAGIKKQGSAA